MALAQITTFTDGYEHQASDLVAAVHDALVSALHVPANDPTVWYRQVAPMHSVVAERHGQGAVLVEITMFRGRRAATIARLHEEIATRLSAVGIDPAAILTVITESPPRNWSIGGVPQDHVDVDVGFDIDV